LPSDVKPVLQLIRTEAKELANDVGRKLGETFDDARHNKWLSSPIPILMAWKGCYDLDDGLFQALFNKDFAANGTQELAKYGESCPWLKDLALVSDEESLLDEVETGLNETDGESLLQLSASGSQAISPMLAVHVVQGIVAISSAWVMMKGIQAISKGFFCSDSTAEDEDHDEAYHSCAHRLGKHRNPCWKNHMLPGIQQAVRGGVMLSLSGLGAWALYGKGKQVFLWGAYKIAGPAIGHAQELHETIQETMGRENLLDSDKIVGSVGSAYGSAKDAWTRLQMNINTFVDTIVGLIEGTNEETAIKRYKSCVLKFKSERMASWLYEEEEQQEGKVS